MAEEKESTSIPLSQVDDSGDPAKSPPNSPSSSTPKACCTLLQSWVSKKFMTGCVVLFPVAVTFFITRWFIQFVDGFFSPLYARLGVDIFGLGFLTSLVFVFLVGIFVSSWLGATLFSLGEWIIKKLPFMRHIYSASKQISTAISPDQNTTAFKEVAIIRHPRVGEYAFGFITSSMILQTDTGDEELCSVYIPTNHIYIGDIFLVNSAEIIRPNLSIREGIGLDSLLLFLMQLNGEIRVSIALPLKREFKGLTSLIKVNTLPYSNLRLHIFADCSSLERIIIGLRCNLYEVIDGIYFIKKLLLAFRYLPRI